MQYTNSEIAAIIAERIHSERDRRLLRRRFIDGQTYDELSVEFFLSRRQVARIIARARSILTTEHPPDNGTKRALSRHCGGALFCVIMGAEGGKADCKLSGLLCGGGCWTFRHRLLMTASPSVWRSAIRRMSAGSTRYKNRSGRGVSPLPDFLLSSACVAGILLCPLTCATLGGTARCIRSADRATGTACRRSHTSSPARACARSCAG